MTGSESQRLSSADSPSRGARSKREASDEEPMQTDGHVPGPKDNPLYTAEPLTLEDLTLLSELFYLPYEHGPTAVAMLNQLHWLRSNSAAATTGAVTSEKEKVGEMMSGLFWKSIEMKASGLVNLCVFVFSCRLSSGVREPRSLMTCVLLSFRCSTDCQTSQTDGSSTTSTTTSVTSRAESLWPEPSSKHSVHSLDIKLKYIIKVSDTHYEHYSQEVEPLTRA